MTPWVVKGEAFGELIRKETSCGRPWSRATIEAQ
jgi:hypothetical protein